MIPRPGRDQAGLDADHRPSQLGEAQAARRPGPAGRPRRRPRPRRSSGGTGPGRTSPPLRPQDPEDDRGHGEREEQDAAHPGRQGEQVDAVEDRQQERGRSRFGPRSGRDRVGLTSGDGPGRGLAGAEAAVDAPDLAGDPGRLGPEQEGDRRGHVVGLAEPARAGACASLKARLASFRSRGAASGVSVRPGATALIRMPWRAYVIAADRTSPSIPPLAAAIVSWLFSPWRTATVLTSTIEPDLLRPHRPERGLGGEEGGRQVDVEGLGELLGGRQVERLQPDRARRNAPGRRAGRTARPPRATAASRSSSRPASPGHGQADPPSSAARASSGSGRRPNRTTESPRADQPPGQGRADPARPARDQDDLSGHDRRPPVPVDSSRWTSKGRCRPARPRVKRPSIGRVNDEGPGTIGPGPRCDRPGERRGSGVPPLRFRIIFSSRALSISLASSCPSWPSSGPFGLGGVAGLVHAGELVGVVGRHDDGARAGRIAVLGGGGLGVRRVGRRFGVGPLARPAWAGALPGGPACRWPPPAM